MERQSQVSRQQEAKMEVLRVDTLVGRQLYAGVEYKQVMIRQVLLAPPDTFDRQYVQAITEVVAVDEHSYQGENEVREERLLHTKVAVQEQSETLKKRRVSSGFNPVTWFLVVGVLLLIVGGIKYCRRCFAD